MMSALSLIRLALLNASRLLVCTPGVSTGQIRLIFFGGEKLSLIEQKPLMTARHFSLSQRIRPGIRESVQGHGGPLFPAPHLGHLQLPGSEEL